MRSIGIIKKIIGITTLTIVAFGTLSFNVMAAQNEIEQTLYEGVNADKRVEHQISEEDIKELREKFRNFSMELPEEDYEWGENEISEVDIVEMSAISTYATTTSPGGLHWMGTKTSTNSLSDLGYDVSGVYDEYFTKYDLEKDKSYSYRFGNYVSDSFIVPGIITTNVNGQSCGNMTIQGLEYSNGYMFITAYCSEKEHNSVIYVVQASTHQYITTLVTHTKSHLGGITYANGNLWLCSGYNNNGKAILYYYDYEDINEAINYAKTHSSLKSIDISEYKRGQVYLDSQDKNSFISTCNGYLCVGEYHDLSDMFDDDPVMAFYVPIPANGTTLEAVAKIEIPENIQGIEFYKQGSTNYMFFSQSCTTIFDSSAYVYKIKDKKVTYTREITLPCMSEGIAVYNGKVYVAYESSAEQYRDGFLSAWDIVDKICGMSPYLIYK